MTRPTAARRLTRWVLWLPLLGSGCANPLDPALRRSLLTIERTWPVIRDKSAPAAGVDSASYSAATAAMDYAVTEGGEAARAE